jgi:hypothetical protein
MFGQCGDCDLDFEANVAIDWVGQKCSHCGGDVHLLVRDGKPVEAAKVPQTQVERLLLTTTTSVAYVMRSQADRKYVYKHLMALATEQESEGKLTAAEAALVRSKVEEFWGVDGIRDREYKALTRFERRARAA